MDARNRKIAKAGIEFTKTYIENRDKHIAVREAECLGKQWPVLLDDIKEGDIFAGRFDMHGYVVRSSPQGFDFGSPTADMESFDDYKFQQSGYCINPFLLRTIRDSDEELKDDMQWLLDFWRGECTFDRTRKLIDEYENASYIEPRGKWGDGKGYVVRGQCIRIGGIMLDYRKLVRNGLDGLRDMIRAEMGKGKDDEFYAGMISALDTLTDVCFYYRDMAIEKAKTTDNDVWRGDLYDMAKILEKIAHEKPETMKEAIQLVWIYNVVSSVGSFTRMDTYLSEFYCNDIDSGRLTEEEAIRILTSLWNLIDETIISSDGRIFIGGMGRENEEQCDRFALAAIETTRRYKRILPTLTLRFYEGQNPLLMEKALDCIGEGCLYPLLYNDDMYVKGLSKLLDIPFEDAIHYLPLGCGEMNLSKVAIASPNTAFILPKLLEALLHEGCDAKTGAQIAPSMGKLSDFDTFESLYNAYKKAYSFLIRVAADVHVKEYEAERTQCAFLYPSILLDDCIEKGKSLVNGGLRYMGGCTEGFGLTNTADSFYAIKKLVYEDKKLTLEQLVHILDANYEGYEAELAMMRSLPKYGNDCKEVDEIVADLSDFTNKEANRAGKEAGLDFFFISSVNPGGIEHGPVCGATPDGRKNATAFAVGNSPTAGNDKQGLTALFSSVAKVSSENGGNITNLKLSSEFFKEHRDLLEKILETFWKKGGAQLNITVVNKGDLEKAMVEPGKYSHIIVRVGGWSARFIDLPDMHKKEVLERMIY
ncbi:MAG: hypothetical protein E7491_02065 [Ruminococcaceae bacterium]|nr:hypothetical protein [Oscillospiraceae bacterium]